MISTHSFENIPCSAFFLMFMTTFCLDSRIQDPAFFPCENDITCLICSCTRWNCFSKLRAYPKLVLHAEDHQRCKQNKAEQILKHLSNSCVFLYKRCPLLVSNKVYLFSSCFLECLWLLNELVMHFLLVCCICLDYEVSWILKFPLVAPFVATWLQLIEFSDKLNF